MGIAYLAASARASGFPDVSVWNQDIYHYPDETITEYIENGQFDIVGFGVCGYQQYRKGLSLATHIKRAKNKPLFVLGAHGPSAAPEFFLEKYQADIVLRGEGELIFTNLLKALHSKSDFRKINGITWREEEHFFSNPDEKLIEKLDELPLPAWDLFPMEHYVLDKVNAAKHTDRCFPILASRGCPQRCNFCYRMYEGYRLRSIPNVLNEIRELKTRYGITYITFVDENLMSSRNRALSFCKGIKNSQLNISWDCMGRLNVAQKDVLKAMKEAGCAYINYGIESVDQMSLNLMQKDLKVEEIYDGIDNTVEAGIFPGLNVIWGNIGDNEETLIKGRDFLIKYNTPLQIRTIKPVTPYPGTKLFEIAKERGLLKDATDFYERYLNTDRFTVNFTNLPEEKCYELLFEANKAVTLAYYDQSAKRAIEGFRKCYFEKDTNFRGPRHT